MEPKIEPSWLIQKDQILEVNIFNQQIKFPEAQEPNRLKGNQPGWENHQFIMVLRTGMPNQ